MVAVAILADVIAPHAYDAADLRSRLLPPSPSHPFGTDELGRCVLSRIIYGARISFLLGSVIVASSMVVGVAMGIVAGYAGGAVDSVLMRLIDVLLSFPGILLALAIVAALGPGLGSAATAVAVVSIPPFARLSRARALSIRREEYVQAARAVGAGAVRIMWKHVLPNAITPVLIQASLEVPRAIIFIATLSFLGIGAQPPTPEWGAMLSAAKNYLRVAPRLTIFTGSALFLTALAFNAVGDGLRDACDPQSYRRLRLSPRPRSRR